MNTWKRLVFLHPSSETVCVVGQPALSDQPQVLSAGDLDSHIPRLSTDAPTALAGVGNVAQAAGVATGFPGS